MADTGKRRIGTEDFFNMVLMELPALSASEMEQGHFIKQKLALDSDVEAELFALRIWYISQALFGSLLHRGNIKPEVTLEILRRFIESRGHLTEHLNLDFHMRCEFYERAMQHDLEDEGHGAALLDTFCNFVGSRHSAIQELFYAAMVGITTRLAKTAERFDVV